MGFRSKAKQFEKLIEKKISGAAAAAPEPLDVVRAVVGDVQDRIVPAPGGRLTFPYDRVLVRVAVSPDARRPWKATLDGTTGRGKPFSEIGVCMTSSGSTPYGDCDGRNNTATYVYDSAGNLTQESDPAPLNYQENWTYDWFHLEYHRRRAEQTVAVPIPRVQLAVLKGVATRKRYTFQSTRINIGRSAEVLSAEQSAVARRNDVAFSDDKTDKASQTVSRVHAHISYHSAERAFSLHDDRSLKGTRIVREGAELTLAKGSPRGEKLRTGDEIQVGDAALRFIILEEAD